MAMTNTVGQSSGKLPVEPYEDKLLDISWRTASDAGP